jgi:hypothetical protein
MGVFAHCVSQLCVGVVYLQLGFMAQFQGCGCVLGPCKPVPEYAYLGCAHECVVPAIGSGLQDCNSSNKHH